MAVTIVYPDDFKKCSMRELVEWFNENCSEREQIKSFRTLAIGCARCVTLMEALDAQNEFEAETDHLTDEEFEAMMRAQLGESEPATESQSAVQKSVAVAIEEGSKPGDNEARSVSLVKRKDLSSSEKAVSNSEGVSQSWKVPSTKAKRVTRHHVKVTFNGVSEEFGSVRKAFSYYGLPDSKHIRFRGKLKASGAEVFEWESEKFHFELVEIKDGK